MSGLTITTDRLREWNACADGYRWFATKFPQGAEYVAVALALREDKRYSDAAWLLESMFSEFADAPETIKPVTVAEVESELAHAKPLLEEAEKASSGNYSRLASSGNDSRLASSGGDSICMSAGLRSTAKAGENGAIALTWHDGKRQRISVAYVGENGIKAGVFYRLDDAGNFVEVES
jgi:hypothetical protein